MLHFFKDFVIYGFASVLGKLAAIFLLPVYTNILTQEEYGAMALITSVKGIIDLFSNLNIHSGIAREYHEKGVNKTELVSTGFYSILSISIIILLIMMCTQSFWIETVLSLGCEHLVAFQIMLLSIPTGSVMSYFSILTRFKKKPILYTVGTTIQLLIQFLTTIICLVYYKFGIASIFGGVLCGELFGILFFTYINREHIAITFNKEYIKRALIFAIPTLPAILAGWLDSSLGQIIIGKYISIAELGIYSIALQLSSSFSIIGIALNNIWGPYLYENYNKKNFKNEVSKIYKMLVFSLTAIAVSVSLLSEEIIVLLSNNSYVEAKLYFSLLCIPMCLYLLFPIATSGISISRDTKYIGISYVIGSILNIFSILIMIPTIGMKAVPISLGISRLITYTILYYVSKKKGVIVLPNGILIILIISILSCYVINTFNFNLLFRILLVLIFDVTILFALIYKPAKNWNV